MGLNQSSCQEAIVAIESVIRVQSTRGIPHMIERIFQNFLNPRKCQFQTKFPQAQEFLQRFGINN